MLTETFQRLIWPTAPNEATGRAEVCPPSAPHPPRTRSWRNSLRDWLVSGWHASSYDDAQRPHAPAAGLGPVREEFLATLHDIRTQEAGMLLGRLRIANSLRELWHLRPEVYRLVALRFSQAEAERRLARLNRHFPARSPRSGFTPLDA